MKDLGWFLAGMFVGEIGLRWIERAVYAAIIVALSVKAFH